MTMAKKTRKVSELKIIGRQIRVRPPRQSYSAPAAVRTRPPRTRRLEGRRYTVLNLAQVNAFSGRSLRRPATRSAGAGGLGVPPGRSGRRRGALRFGWLCRTAG